MATHIASGKQAITFFRKISDYQHISHLELTLETGRTHQIHVHLSSLLKTPILADQTYADVNKQKQLLKDLYQNFLEGYEHPLLHAKSLGFKHPISGKDLFFTAPPPSPFKDLLQYLEENKNKTS